jgi:hypothetical protein
MRLSHIGAPQFGHSGELRTSRAGSNPIDAGMGGLTLNIGNLVCAGAVSSRRLLKLSECGVDNIRASARAEFSFDIEPRTDRESGQSVSYSI